MDDSPWAKLVKCILKENEYFPVVKSTYTIGRKADCDVMVDDHRASGVHCVLLRRGKKGGPAIKDVSSNGTLLNGKRLDKQLEVELAGGDCITIVQNKDDSNKNIAYKFVDLRGSDECDATLTYEEDCTQDGPLTEEETVRATVSEDEVKEESSCEKKKKKRPLEGAESGPASKVRATDSDENEVPTGHASSKAKGGGAAAPILKRKDSIEETLICQICQEILHDCVSLQPCMHSYCGGCYSDWMMESNTCPACRKKVLRIGKNHIVNNLVDAYLRANPDKKRPEEDLRDLDSKNKITGDIDYSEARRTHRTRVYYSPPSEVSEYLSDLSESSSSSPPLTTLSSYRCMQCPGGDPLITSIYSSFTCTPTTRHTNCTCCFRSMPIREDDPRIIQKCTLCNSYYCHLYWNCTKPSCLGCLAKFKDIHLPNTCLNGILGNAYESNILKEYIDRKGWSITDFIGTISGLLDSGTLSVSSHGVTLTTATVICFKCANDVLKKLAYDYRKTIPNDELPVSATSRINCYWGRECRTQFTNPAHAMRHNHVCEKTRTS